jgi:hypothetical protein
MLGHMGIDPHAANRVLHAMTSFLGTGASAGVLAAMLVSMVLMWPVGDGQASTAVIARNTR